MRGHARTRLYPLLVIFVLSAGVAVAPQSGTAADGSEVHAWEDQVLFAETAAEFLRGPDAATWMTRLDARYNELKTVLDAVTAKGPPEAALRLATALSPYWARKAMAAEARAALDAALQREDAQAATPERAAALNEAGHFAFRQGDQSAATSAHREALGIFERLGDESGVASSLALLARTALRDDDHQAVAEHATRAATLFDQLGDRAGLAGARHMLAVSAEMRGDHTSAAALYDELFRLHREEGNQFMAAVEQYNLASVRLKQGRLDEAQVMLEESLALSLSVGDEAAVPYALLRFAAIAVERGNVEKGARLFGTSAAQFDANELQMDPAEQQDFDRYVTTSRTALGEGQFAALFAQGQALTPEAALELARQP